MNKITLLTIAMLFIAPLAEAQTENYSYPDATALPQDDTSNLLRDPGLLTGYDLNLSAARFARAWLSKTNERERIKADMYMLGVVDASEGKAWCKGHPILPNTIYEFLYSRFAHLSEQEGKRRASEIITDGMGELSPCQHRTGL
ncbi:Rap1a/Tai family immunity protein [Enterobacter sp. BIDMC92]|uniref:Rap1a/Tai family immunity protein n=1 Tax=Enterobacter sp. BIDMC92 TaxID=1594172 RepID=UPI00064D240B|nr:Rap1a/Tai family immunity protein [Enterobacter sp. BIDMC92]